MTKRLIAVCCLTLFLTGCLFSMGCEVKGHRQIGIRMANELVIYDRVENNSEGKDEYEADLTEPWQKPVIEYLFVGPPEPDADGVSGTAKEDGSDGGTEADDSTSGGGGGS